MNMLQAECIVKSVQAKRLAVLPFCIALVKQEKNVQHTKTLNEAQSWCLT